MAKGCKARTSVKKKEHAGKLCHIYIDNALKRFLVAGSNKNGGRPDKTDETEWLWLKYPIVAEITVFGMAVQEVSVMAPPGTVINPVLWN